MLTMTITAHSVKELREKLKQVFEQLPLPGFDSVGSAPTLGDTPSPGGGNSNPSTDTTVTDVEANCGRRAVVTPASRSMGFTHA